MLLEIMKRMLYISPVTLHQDIEMIRQLARLC